MVALIDKLCEKMTSVKSTSKAGAALFATKDYKAGDIILEETPLLTLQKKSASDIIAIREQFQNIKAEKKVRISALEDLDIPSSIDVKDKTKFRRFVEAAASFALVEDENIREKYLSLYYPAAIDSDESVNNESDSYESGVIQLAESALVYLQRQTTPTSKLNKLVTNSSKNCLKAMLIWACNSFEGGLVYELTSRINHSCDFNAVVCVDPFQQGSGGTQERQTIRAAAAIKEGDEICISYLGSYTYADFSARNERLQKEKFFNCMCKRCETNRIEGDVAGSVPCFQCHPRDGRYLDEDVQYDDGAIEVNYCKPCIVKDSSSSKPGDRIVYRCAKCGDVEIDSVASKAMSKAIERATAHLDEGLKVQAQIDDDEEERATKIELTERMACLATSVLGAKHYASSLLTFVSLSAKLSLIHCRMLCESADQGSGGDQEELMSDIAECIDSLERVINYLESIGLQSHFGQLVGNACIGVARVLIGFGDEKSVKYGCTFLSKVYDNYFKLSFEGEGMKKVVEALMSKNASHNNDEAEPQKKRHKSS